MIYWYNVLKFRLRYLLHSFLNLFRPKIKRKHDNEDPYATEEIRRRFYEHR